MICDCTTLLVHWLETIGLLLFFLTSQNICMSLTTSLDRVNVYMYSHLLISVYITITGLLILNTKLDNPNQEHAQ